ncbi:MAG: type II toxin-antitoxin system HicA family toxin [Candidatus Taylorbacteria bacterium]
MRRNDLVRHIERYNCRLIREGARHSIFRNTISGRTSTVPRHTEIDDFLAKKICKDLGIPKKS